MRIWKLSQKILLSNTRANSIASYNSKISVIGLVLALSALILTTSFSKGYRLHLLDTMSNIFGHAYIEKHQILNNSANSRMLMNNQDIDYIRYKLGDDSINGLYGLNSENSVLYKSKVYKGVIHNKIITNDLYQDFHFKNFIISGNNYSYNNGNISIGNSLAKELDFDLFDSISLLNISDGSNMSLNAERLRIGSIYSTNLFDYDESFLFSVLLDTNATFNNMILQLDSSIPIESLDRTLILNDSIYYKINTWDEEFVRQLHWLDQFEAPIKLIMYFILLVALFHLLSSFYILITEKENTISLLMAFGFTKFKIYLIFLLRSMFLAVFSMITAIFFAVLVIYFQDTFHFISIPESIYFINYLPVSWDIAPFIFYSVLSLLFIFLSTLFLVPKLYSINIARCINNA